LIGIEDRKELKNTGLVISNLSAAFCEVKNICANVIDNDCRKSGIDCGTPEIIF
jgi:hypothetical protein